MMKLFYLAVVIAVAAAIAAADLDTEWFNFKVKHNKHYNEGMEPIRKKIWKENKKYIEEHNVLYAQGLSSYFLGENEFADMTGKEFVTRMNGMRVVKEPHPQDDSPSQPQPATALPDAVDWRKDGYVTPIKNQAQCGSCWAFSATGAMEGQHFKSNGSLVSLSESNLVDCSQSFDNHACDGGLMDNAFKYVIHNKGIDTESSYPYRPALGPCRFNAGTIGATIVSYRDLKSGSEPDLQQAVAEIGPISVAIDASHSSFQHYSGGIYDPWFCSHTKLDHGVLVIGYGTDEQSSKPYWLIKNSWGVSWGDLGYFKLIRNDHNKCGVATSASYPIV